MKIFILMLLCLFMTAQIAEARGSFSSGGRGSFSSSRSFGGSRSYSSPSRSYSSPSRSTGSSLPSRSYSSTPSTTTTTTRTVNRSNYYGSGMNYGGMGMGYPYYGNNGLLTGLIIGNMMHPHGTTVYQGGGYSQPALQYPDGRIVNQQGVQVGTYNNGQFVATPDGQMIAQSAPVTIQQGITTGEVIAWVSVGVIAVFIVLMIIL